MFWSCFISALRTGLLKTGLFEDWSSLNIQNTGPDPEFINTPKDAVAHQRLMT